MTVKTASPCGCIEEIWGGKKARRECDHGNPFLGKQLGRSTPVDAIKGGDDAIRISTPKPRSTLKRTRRKESKAERAARDHFNATVKSWPCWFGAERPCGGCDGLGEIDASLCGYDAGTFVCPDCDGDGHHHCSGRKDAHHLIPKSFIRKRFSHLPEDQLLAILFNPKLGAPLCRKAHDRLEAGFDRIYWEDLTDECIEYVGSLPDFMLLRLEEECPKRPEPCGAVSSDHPAAEKCSCNYDGVHLCDSLPPERCALTTAD